MKPSRFYGAFEGHEARAAALLAVTESAPTTCLASLSSPCSEGQHDRRGTAAVSGTNPPAPLRTRVCTIENESLLEAKGAFALASEDGRQVAEAEAQAVDLPLD